MPKNDSEHIFNLFLTILILHRQRYAQIIIYKIYEFMKIYEQQSKKQKRRETLIIQVS